MATSDSRIANWNGWPDGQFACDLTFEEYEKTGNLKIHWAHRVMGGDRTGDLHATVYQKGKRRARRCLGTLDCENPDCEVVVRPHVRPEAIDKQMISGCPKCHSSLTRVTCDNISKIWIYAGGVHYENGESHSHGRLPHILGLLPEEQERFESIVKAHPNAGPLELIHGVATINGPGESVADISECLINADRVNKEKQKYSRSQGMTGDAFVSAFSEFCKKNPGFVIFSQVSDVTVICFQSGFMASQLVKEGILDGPVNGLVTDATHSFFKDREAKLVISSIYSPDLACWVPGIFSYTNGSTIQHYKYHFLALFQSIEHESSLRGIEITDEMFAGVRTYFFILIEYRDSEFYRYLISATQSVADLFRHLWNFILRVKTHEQWKNSTRLLLDYFAGVSSIFVPMLLASRKFMVLWQSVKNLHLNLVQWLCLMRLITKAF